MAVLVSLTERKGGMASHSRSIIAHRSWKKNWNNAAYAFLTSKPEREKLPGFAFLGTRASKFRSEAFGD